MRVLEELKAGSLQEKSIARRIRLDGQFVAEIVTNLMFKGYIERSLRRRLLFFHREYFAITPEGLAALESSKGDLSRIVEIIKAKGQAVASDILEELPPIATVTIKATWRAAKFILK
jgi:hypothetical protein